jgi:hypothetical protein
MGLMDTTVGCGLGPRQHFGLNDPGQETQMAEFQLRGLAQQIVEAVDCITELKTTQIGQELVSFLGSHWSPHFFPDLRAFSFSSRS